MEARLFRIATAVAILASGFCAPAFAASVRTQNFIIQADTQEFAELTGQWAEKYRRELSLEWLGAELPPWREPCPIRVDAGPNKAAQGETSFVFDGRGMPGRWSMTVIGTQDRVLDAVLPHEITHTIFATHFGRPLPRWADEGACTTVEHESERIKHEHNLVRYLKSERGIAFNKMFVMKQYPSDILPLYAQGYSLARYLILQGGRQKYVKFLEDGMAWNNWNAAIEKHYGYSDLSDLQVTWLDWVRVGSPMELQPRPAADTYVTTPVPPGQMIPPPAPQPATGDPTGPSTFARPRDIDLVSDESGTLTRTESGAILNWYESKRQERSRRDADPIPDNRRPQQPVSTSSAPTAVAGTALPPNLPPAQGSVQVLPPDVWTGPNSSGGTSVAADGSTSGPNARWADSRPVPGTVPAPQPGLVPIDSAPANPYAAGSLLR